MFHKLIEIATVVGAGQFVINGKVKQFVFIDQVFVFHFFTVIVKQETYDDKEKTDNGHHNGGPVGQQPFHGRIFHPIQKIGGQTGLNILIGNEAGILIQKGHHHIGIGDGVCHGHCIREILGIGPVCHDVVIDRFFAQVIVQRIAIDPGGTIIGQDVLQGFFGVHVSVQRALIRCIMLFRICEDIIAVEIGKGQTDVAFVGQRRIGCNAGDQIHLAILHQLQNRSADRHVYIGMEHFR